MAHARPFWNRLPTALGCVLAFAGFQLADEVAGAEPSTGQAAFVQDVLPVLKKHCFRCHQGRQPKSGVRLDHRAQLLGETDGVALVTAGDSAGSRLIQLVTEAVSGQRMPPSGEGRLLDDRQVQILRDWIDQGVAWDDDRLPDPHRVMALKHWSFQPVVKPKVPQTVPLRPAPHPIDAFIGRRLRAAGLKPASVAAPATRVRRLYLRLQGLPPTPEDLRAASMPGSWEQTVDRVLDSKHYGEHMARLWLDVARWAESEGFAENTDWPFAWRYRDFVAHSFFRDQSYATFLRQQISGDEMEPYRDENLVATGFLATARISADDLNCYRQENELYCDLVNATTSAVLGLTMGCARCHDHKFDPISQRDYYRFQAFFVRGMPGNVILAEASRPAALDQVADELLKLTLQVRRRVLNEGYDLEPVDLREILRLSESQRSLQQERLYRPARVRLNMRVAGCNGFRIQPEEKKRLDELTARLETLAKQAAQTWAFYSPVSSPHRLSVLPMKANFPLLHDRDRLAGKWSYLLARGDIYQPAARLEPGWPAAFGPALDPRLRRRPRTALVDWMTDRSNPLTARVWVNRIWQQHFGRGLVATAGNFGIRGEKPSHPELLDWLAAELMEHDWSTKHIHRLIVTSRTWQQSARFDAANAAIDAENRYLWRWPVRRLSAEAIRDAMLVASGELDRQVGGTSVPPARQRRSSRRSLYLAQRRDAPPAMQALFDGPTAMSESCSTRQVSTTPLQSLYLLNNNFSRDRSYALAERVRRLAADSRSRQIELAYRVALNRRPDAVELATALDFFQGFPDPPDTKPQPKTLSPPDWDASLGFWLRADKGVQMAGGGNADDAAAVSQWQDQPGGTDRPLFHFAQAASHRQPRWVDGAQDGINGLPVVRFAGGAFGESDHFLTVSQAQTLDVTKSYTMFFVVRFNGSGQRNEALFLQSRNGGNDVGSVGVVRMAGTKKLAIAQNIAGEWKDRVFSAEPVPDHVPLLVVARWDGSQMHLELFDADGAVSHDSVKLTGVIDPGDSGRVSLGGYVDAFSDQGERFNGDMGEVLFFRDHLAPERRAQATAYLRQRWLRSASVKSPLEIFCQALLNLNEFVYVY